MMNNQLDNAFLDEIQKTFSTDETLKWSGNPNPKFSFTLLEFGGHFDALTGLTSILGFMLGGILFGSYTFYKAENWVGLVLTLIIGLISLFIPDILKHKRKQNTKYAFTNKRVYFQLWRWGKTNLHSIDLKDITQITVEEYKDKSGILHFLPKKPFDFYTYDFVSGEKRFYPTFEMVADVRDLHGEMESFRLLRLKG
jgi:hypothetical protein